MNWKKVGLFILFFILGFILMGLILGLVHSYSSIIFFFYICYLIALFFTIREFSIKKLIITLSIFIIFFIVILIPWPDCVDYKGGYITKGFIEGGAFPLTQQCTCIGFKQKFAIAGGGPYTTYTSQCIGIPTDFKCYKGIYKKEEISCLEAGFG